MTLKFKPLTRDIQSQHSRVNKSNYACQILTIKNLEARGLADNTHFDFDLLPLNF